MSSMHSGGGMAPSRHDVEEWLERIDEITASVHEILNEDPMEAAQRQREREVQRRQMEIIERREKVKMRYDPRYYTRFENDELIDKLLKEADDVTGKKKRKANENKSLYTTSERVSLEEALRLKDEAAKAVKNSEWEKARELYTSAVILSTLDPTLHRTLRSNRALVQLKLKNFLDAVDDASYVLQEEPTNVKALLRRATALRQLHRPLDALKDAEAALKREPASQEAEELARWLRRARREHGVCAAFQHHHLKESKRLEDAVNILSPAVTALCESYGTHTEDSLTKTCTDNDKYKAAMMRAAEGVRQCLEVVQSFHRGAAVLFTLLHGLKPLVELICFLLSGGWLELVGSENDVLSGKMSIRGMTFVVSARLLALIFTGAETGTEGLDPLAFVDLGKGLADVLMGALQEERLIKQEDTTVTIMGAVMQAMEGLALRSPVQVYAHCGSAVMATWNVFVSTRQRISPKLLFFYCGLLEAFLREPSVAVEVTKDIQEKRALLPRIIEMSITMGPMQLKEAGLSLAVRATCVNGTWAKMMSSPEFTRALANVLPLSQKGHRDVLSPRAEEGLYAVVYNILLQVESRSEYVGQWRAVTQSTNGGDLSFILHTWRTLCEHVMSTAESTSRVTVCPKMMGVITKFFPHDEALRSAMVKNEETLWTMLKAALSEHQTGVAEQVIVTDDRESTSKREEEYEEGEEEKKEVAESSAWELIEHTTTCIASLYSQNPLLREEGLLSWERIAVLLRIVRRAGVNHMVALGNAALIGSFVPSTGCGHYATLQGVDVLLEGLRRVREFLFKLEHDGKKGSAQWIHAGVAQKNLAIAISKCCVVESQRERMRELRGFETLHAVIG